MTPPHEKRGNLPAIAGIGLALLLIGVGITALYLRSGTVVCREGYRATIGVTGIFCAVGYVP